MADSQTAVLELSTESSYDLMERFVGLVEEAAKLIGLSEDEETDLMISVMEAVNNAIQHGNGGDSSKQVRLRIRTAPSEVTIWVADEGQGFRLENVPDPRHPQNLMNDSGRGILMMQAFMDRVEFCPKAEGLVVKMTKRFSRKHA